MTTMQLNNIIVTLNTNDFVVSMYHGSGQDLQDALMGVYHKAPQFKDITHELMFMGLGERYFADDLSELRDAYRVLYIAGFRMVEDIPQCPDCGMYGCAGCMDDVVEPN
jgi:hypothetical protein